MEPIKSKELVSRQSSHGLVENFSLFSLRKFWIIWLEMRPQYPSWEPLDLPMDRPTKYFSTFPILSVEEGDFTCS